MKTGLNKKLIYFMIASAAILTGCASAQNVSVTPPSDGQRLVIYTAHKEEVYRPVIEEFEDQTGIWVDVQAGGTTQMLRRIRQEQSAVTSGKTPPADIMFGGGAENLEAYRDCFAPYHSPLEDNISSSFRSSDGTWTPFTELPIVFIYNSKLCRAGKRAAQLERFSGRRMERTDQFCRSSKIRYQHHDTGNAQTCE